MTASSDAPAGNAALRGWIVRIVAIGLLVWLLDKHGGMALLSSIGDRLGMRWPLLLIPWACTTVVGMAAYQSCLPRRGKDAPQSVLVRVQLAGAALNTILPLGASSSNIMKISLLRHWYSAEALVAAGIWGSLGTGIGNALSGLGPLTVLSLGFGEPWVIVTLAAITVAMGIPAVTAVALVSKGLSERVTRLVTLLPFEPLRRRSQSLINWAARVDVHLAAAVGERRGDFVRLVALRALFQVIRVLEIWLAAELLGIPDGLLIALLYNTMTRTISQVARFVPGQWGVLEATAGAMFVALGLDAQSGIALALALRIRHFASLVAAFTALGTINNLPGRYPPRNERERVEAGLL